jgi:hypothetical protein
MQPGFVVLEQPRDHFILGLVPGHEALPVQAPHLHACQLGEQPADFHLPGAHRPAVRARESALTRRLHPVEERLVNHSERF